jgi:hypothetical protein
MERAKNTPCFTCWGAMMARRRILSTQSDHNASASTRVLQGRIRRRPIVRGRRRHHGPPAERHRQVDRQQARRIGRQLPGPPRRAAPACRAAGHRGPERRRRGRRPRRGRRRAPRRDREPLGRPRRRRAPRRPRDAARAKRRRGRGPHRLARAARGGERGGRGRADAPDARDGGAEQRRLPPGVRVRGADGGGAAPEAAHDVARHVPRARRRVHQLRRARPARHGLRRHAAREPVLRARRAPGRDVRPRHAEAVRLQRGRPRRDHVHAGADDELQLRGRGHLGGRRLR